MANEKKREWMCWEALWVVMISSRCLILIFSVWREETHVNCFGIRLEQPTSLGELREGKNPWPSDLEVDFVPCACSFPASDSAALSVITAETTKESLKNIDFIWVTYVTGKKRSETVMYWFFTQLENQSQVAPRIDFLHVILNTATGSADCAVA